MSLTGLPRYTVLRLLNKLVEAGVLRTEGNTRARRYVANPGDGAGSGYAEGSGDGAGSGYRDGESSRDGSLPTGRHRVR